MKLLFILCIAEFMALKTISAENFLNNYEKKIFSQNGEDGIIRKIFHLIGNTNKIYLDIGAGNGKDISNTFNLYANGWKGLGIDGAFENPSLNIIQKRITRDNILSILENQNFPKDFDFLSLDIDSIDFYVLLKLLQNDYRPRLICAEYNASFDEFEDAVVNYDPNLVWNGSNYYGASFKAYDTLADKFGYKIICSDRLGINLFMILKEDYANLDKDILSQLTPIYHQAKYGWGAYPKDALKRKFTSAKIIFENLDN